MGSPPCVSRLRTKEIPSGKGLSCSVGKTADLESSPVFRDMRMAVRIAGRVGGSIVLLAGDEAAVSRKW